MSSLFAQVGRPGCYLSIMAVDPSAQRFLDLVAGAPPLDTQTAEQNRVDLRAAVPALAGSVHPMASIEDFTLPGPGGPIPVRA